MTRASRMWRTLFLRYSNNGLIRHCPCRVEVLRHEYSTESAASVSAADTASLWQPIIGVEVHCQLMTNSKLFSPSSTQPQSPPNSQASLYDCAHPGTLPRLNRRAVHMTIMTGLALNGQVQRRSRFERKHYFYADMPTAYQITQQRDPIVRHGHIDVTQTISQPNKQSLTKPSRIRLSRIQLEQDSGKGIHDALPQHSLIDLNRAGVALMEIVSEPDLTSADETVAFIRSLSATLTAVGTCRAQMEDGSMRVDVNVSLRHKHTKQDSERVEIKNLNSLRAVTRAVQFETARQRHLIAINEPIQRQTRAFDAKTGNTLLLRSKENMLDYRFAPEWDLPELLVTDEMIQTAKDQMPELPEQTAQRLSNEFGLPPYDIGVLMSEPGAVTYYEALVRNDGGKKRDAKMCANWIVGDLFGRIRQIGQQAKRRNHDDTDDNDDISDENDDIPLNENASLIGDSGVRATSMLQCPVSVSQLGSIIDLISNSIISGKVGKQLLNIFITGKEIRSAEQIIKDNNWIQIKDTNNEILLNSVKTIIKDYNKEVNEYLLKKNKRFIGFLAGQVIKLTKGQVNPKDVTAAIEQELDQLASTNQNNLNNNMKKNLIK